MYIGGYFSAINKTVRRNLAAIDLAAGTILPSWAPSPIYTTASNRTPAVQTMKIKDNLLYIGGVFNAMEGIVALVRNEIYVATPRYLFAFDLTTWGWIQLILGIVVAIAGFGVITGQLWGRLVGIALAALSMLANFAFIPYYPLWSLSIIALNVFVIWALCVYNRDTAASL